MTDGDRPDEAAYADLVAGLLDARDDLAGTRFDVALQDAVASGEVSADTARALRFWQRAALRELADHVATVLPATLAALDRARAEAAARLAADETLITGGSAPISDTEREAANTLSERSPIVDDRRRLIVAALTRSTLLDLRAHH